MGIRTVITFLKASLMTFRQKLLSAALVVACAICMTYVVATRMPTSTEIQPSAVTPPPKSFEARKADLH